MRTVNLEASCKGLAVVIAGSMLKASESIVCLCIRLISLTLFQVTTVINWVHYARVMDIYVLLPL